MATQVDMAFAAGRLAWRDGVLRQANPFAAGKSVQEELMAWAWTLGWLRAAGDAARAETQAMRARRQAPSPPGS